MYSLLNKSEGIFKMENKKITIRRGVILVIIAAFFTLLYILNQVDKVSFLDTEGRSFENAMVLEIVEDNSVQAGRQQVKLKILTGELKGKVIIANNSSSYLFGAECKVGSKVVAMISQSGEDIVASVYSNHKSPVLYIMIGLFLLMIWGIGGKQGLYSVIGLLFTFVCIIFLFLPLIYRGISPNLAAILVVVITTAVTMYLVGGATKKTASAIIGTVIGVSIAGILAALFSKLAAVTGYNVSDVENLIYIQEKTGIKVGELLFAGILISALGAVMDVSMSIASTIQEIYDKNKDLTRKELFDSGIHVGRDMMGTMSNTIILAFAGGSINTIVFIYAYNYQYRQIMNMNSIAIELIQGIAASFGVILTVPLVSAISAWLLTVKKK